MKLRIIAGRGLVEKYRSEKELKNIYVSADFLVQGDSSVITIEDKARARAFFYGRVIGRRSGPDTMDSLSKTDVNFKSFVSSQPTDKCLAELEGRFILVKITDKQGCEVCCDRFGRIDLYYQQINEGAVFASDLSLLPFKDGTVKYDPVGIAHALYIYGFRPAKQHTIYRDVKRLGVGEIASWQDNKLGFRQFVFPRIETNENYGEKDIKRYYDIIIDAIAKRASSNGNLIYLSSGWDSSSLLSLLVKLYGANKTRALIGRMHLSKRAGVINQFEIDRAKRIADYFGIKLEIAEYDFWQRSDELIAELQPFMRSHMLTSMSFFFWAVLAAQAAKTSRGEAVFAGETSDGAHNLGFAQFTTIFHPVLEFREYSDKMASYLFGPTFLRSIQNGKFNTDPIYNLLKQKYQGRVFDSPASSPDGCARQLFAALFSRDNRMPLWSLKNTKLMTDRGRQGYSDEMEGTYFNKLETSPETLYASYLRLYNSFHWQGGTVSTLAFTANNYGLEMNLPYWDSRMQDFLSAMPESWGRGLEIKPTKYPLKAMLRQYVDYPWHLQAGPHSYLYDIDPNFSPVGEFIYDSAFTPHLKRLLKSRAYESILSPEFFDLDYINGVTRRYLDGVEASGPERTDLSALSFISLAGWY
ncbi:MAG: asparagine synthase-related protein [Candidatus Omnitrophota bacterium]